MSDATWDTWTLGDHDEGEYEDSCACDFCRAERGRRLSVLMFAPLLPYDLAKLYAMSAVP